MSTLTGRKIANSYKNLLQVETSNTDLDTSLKSVQTGAGNNTPLQLSTDKINLTGTLQINGTTLTAGAATLNAVADLTGTTGLVAVSAGNIHGRSIAVGNPLTISNANGTEGNPTINLASSGVSAATYGPMVNFTVDNFGRITDVTVTTTISANAFVGGTISGSALTVENDTSIGGDVVIEGTTNMKAISATDVTFNNLTVNTKINAVTVTATTIETSILRATTISVTDLTADNINFDNVSVSSLVANVGLFNGDVTFTGDSSNIVFDKSDDALKFANGVKAKFGNNDNLEIFYNGTHSIIRDGGSGDLELDGSTVRIKNAGRSKDMLVANQGGSVELYHNNNKKIETTSDGATLTGNLELLSTDAGASSAPLIELYRHSASPAAEDFLGRIDFYGEDDNDDKVRYGSITSSIFHPTNGNERGRMEIDVMQNGSMTTFVELAANGVYLNKPTFITGDTLITNADADADADPTLTLRRTSPSPAFNDQLGELVFTGRNSAAENVNYGRITTKIATVTDGNEGGNLSFNVLQGGSEAEFMQMAFDNIYVNKQLTMFNNIFLDGNYSIKWDGATNNSNTTSLVVTDPTAVRTITLPDATGTVLVDDGSGNVTISGNLTVSGTTTTVNSSTLSVQDPLIILANNNNSSDAVDIGFYGLYDTSGSQDLYAGLFRDASDSGKFKLFKDLQTEPTTTVNTSGTGYAVGTLVAGLEVPAGSTVTLNSDNSNPAMVIQGSGPNEIMFAADSSGSAADGVSLLYRTTPNDLQIVKASGLGVIAKFNGNTGVAELWHNNNGPKLATTSGGIEITGTVTDDGAIHDGDVTFTGANGNIVFDKSDDAFEFSDSSQIKFGSDFDAFLRHTGSNLELISSTGDIIIADTTGDVRIQGKYGEQSIVANNDGSVELYHDNVKKFETRSNGFAYIDSDVNVEITNQSNQGAIEIGGTSGAFIDLKSPASDDYDARLQVNTSNLFAIYSDDLHLASKTAETYLDATADGSVNLYYDNVKTFETTADGIKVTAPNLGTSNGDTETVADFHINNGNGSSLKINKIRDGNGSNWNTSATRIQQVIDVTKQGYIQFNGNDNLYGLELGTTGSEKFFRGIYNGAVELYHDNVKKIETTSTGATITGELVVDDFRMTTGANSLLKFTSNDGSEGYQIKANVSNTADFGLLIEDLDNNDIAKFLDGGECLLTHNHITRFQTTSTGATVTGTLIADGVTLGDSELITLGTDSDATITHTGSNLEIDNNTGITKLFAGQVYIQGQFGSSDETMAQFSKNGAVQLYYDNELRFRTSSTGIDVLGQDADGTSDNTANVRLIAEGTNEIVTLRSTDGTAQYISRNGDNYGTHLFSGFGTVSPNTVNMLQLTSTGHTSYQDLTIQSTDAGATAGPTLSLYRNSASPANSDDIGQIQWFAENDADEKIEYARIDVKNSGVVDGAEYGQMDFMVINNGSEVVPFRLSFNLVQFYRDLYIGAAYKIQFEGSNYNDFETSLTVIGPTADRTISLPDANGTVVLQDSNGDATIGGGLTVTGGNSGDVLLTFATDRSWQFQQSGDNASTRLQLKSNVDSKLFDIVNSSGNITHTFFTSTVDPSMTLTAYDADATEGPRINLTRNSASPAVNDLLGAISFKGEDSASNEIEYARITGIITDPTDGSEGGLIRFEGVEAGNRFTAYQIGYSANFFYRDLHLMQNTDIRFEGSTDDNFETLFTVTDPTADRTITLPDATGTINELLISSGSVSSVSSIDFNSTILTTEFSSYRLVLLNVKSDTDDVDLSMRVGTANSADSSSIYMQSNYVFGVFNNYGSTAQSGPAVNNHQATAFSLAYNAGGLGTGTGENGHFEISLLNANSTSCYKHIRLNQSVYSYYPVAMGRRIDAAIYKSNSALNFMTIFVSSGNIASADYRLYGVK